MDVPGRSRRQSLTALPVTGGNTPARSDQPVGADLLLLDTAKSSMDVDTLVKENQSSPHGNFRQQNAKVDDD